LILHLILLDLFTTKAASCNGMSFALPPRFSRDAFVTVAPQHNLVIHGTRLTSQVITDGFQYFVLEATGE
jgi:hypothetical protein